MKTSEVAAREFFGCVSDPNPWVSSVNGHSPSCDEIGVDGGWGCERLASAFSEVRREENAEWCAALDFLAGMAGRDRSQDLARLIEWNDKRREALRSEGGA